MAVQKREIWARAAKTSKAIDLQSITYRAG